jgi:hypothetical protein
MSFKRTPNALERMARKKSRTSYPVGTVAFYGPDDRRASKMVVAVIARPGTEDTTVLERWFTDGDARDDPRMARRAADLLQRHGVHRVAMADRIIGCPHEEGIDYPMGEPCPQCPFWKGRDRFSRE